MLADFFTKPLQGSLFRKFQSTREMLDTFVFPIDLWRSQNRNRSDGISRATAGCTVVLGTTEERC